MNDMNVQVTISADASAVGTAAQKGAADLSGFTAAAKEMTSALQAGFAQLSALSEKMNSTLQAGFAQTGLVLRSMASGMGDVREAATAELPKVVPEVEKIEKATKKAELGLGTLGQKLASVGMAMSLAFTAPTVAATAGIFEATKSMDSLKLSLTAVAGSAEGMKRQLQDAKEIAKLPGLGMEEAMTGSIRLQSAGISAEQSKKSLMAFGNALATVGKGKAELDGVTLALSQIQSKGKVFAEEINQLNERLPQIRGAMKAAFGTSNSEDLQKLGVSSEEYISKVTAEFAKLPAVTSGLKNDMENLSDQWKMSLADMGEGLKPFFATALQVFTAVAGKVAELGKWFAGLSESQRGWIVSAVSVAAALGPMLLGLGKLISIGVEMKAMWTAWTGLMEAWKVATLASTVATEGMAGATMTLRTSFMQMTATMLANPFVAAAAAILAVTLAVIGLKKAMDDLNAEEANSKAARSVEATAAQKKVDGYQYAFEHLSAGKDRDEVGRKLGRAKEERDAAFAKDDATIKNGTTLDMGTGGADGAAGFDVKKTLAARGIFDRAAPKEKKKTGVSETWKAELSEREKAFKDAQKLEESQAKLRVESIVDEFEREREIRSAKYTQDLEKAQGNKALLLAVNAKYAQDLRAIETKETEKLDAERTKALNKRIAQAELENSLAQKRLKKAEEVQKEYIESLKPQFEVIKNLAHTVAGAFGSIASKMTDMAVRGDFTLKALGKAFKDMMIGMLADIVSFVAKTMVEVAILATADALTGGIVSAVLGASNGGKGAGGILGFATGGLLSFDVGTPSVPRDMVAQIHQGEMIIPKTFAEGIRKGDVPLGGSGSNKHGATLVIPDDIMAAIASKGSALVKIFNNQEKVSFA